jgi:hypothetical protein
MATTAKGTPYVESSDLVANYPAVSLALAEHIDDFGGKVLQVVQGTTDTTTSTTSTTFVNTSLSVTITPANTSNKVLLLAFNTSIQHNNNAGSTIVTLARDTTALEATSTLYFGTNNSGINVPASLAILDSPASASAITYRTRIRTSVNLNTAGVSGRQNILAIEVSA